MKNTLKVALQYLVNIVILFKTAFYLKLLLKLNIDLKTYTFKNLEETSPNHLATMFLFVYKKKIV